MGSKYVDTTAIMQVIGCVYNDPTILDMQDKYVITDEDFVEDFHKITYGVMYRLRETGAKTITLEAINDYLETKPKKKAIFDLNKGNEYLQKVSAIASRPTFQYYYNRVKKMSLLRAYDGFGLDVSFLYDPDNILDLKKKEIQEEWLDNVSLEEIADSVDSRIAEIREQYADENGLYGASYHAGDGIEELIKRFEEVPDVGVPLYGDYINTITRGARLGKFYLRSAPTGCGKAIPNDTLIPTPQGFRFVRDIKAGDYLFGQDGKPTKVLAIHPQPTKKDVWKVSFKDGRSALCCEDHLWEYRYESHRGYEYRVESLKDLVARIGSLKNGLKDSSAKGYRFAVRLNQPVEYNEKTFSLDPYVMGALLGDGSFRYTPSQKSLSFSSADDELPNRIAGLLGSDIYAKKASEKNYSYSFKLVNNPRHSLWVEEILKAWPELWNCKSEDKFIPPEYLQGSIEQRWSLVQGLMDTDGSIQVNKGRTNFTTISPRLRDDVIELVRSLGMVATYTIDKRADKYTAGECYNISIQCEKSLKPKLFRLERKVKVAQEYANSSHRAEFKDHLAIVNIEKLDYQTDMTCFTVDNDNHLFLMNDYITTHNTRSMIADACYIGCSKVYDDEYGWISSGKGLPTLFIGTEQDKDEIQTMMLSFLSNVNEEHILNGIYQEGERDRVFEAARLIKESPLYIEELPEFNLQDVENVIKRNIREKNVQYVFHDYIHTSLKILEEISKKAGKVALREDNILFMLSARLKEICVKHNIFMMSATQLNGDYQDAKTPDQNLLRGAKSIAD